MAIARSRQFGCHRGFTLGEMLAALVIGAMVLTAILSVYSRLSRAAASVREKIDAPIMANEVLQLIARDLDRIMETSDIEVQFQNGYDNGYPSAQLTLRRTYKDSKNEEQTFEEIVWRSAYDHDSPEPGLVLYRSYSGIGFEDNLLDAKRDEWESNYAYVPVFMGLTYFEIEAPKGDGVVRVWPSGDPPTAVKVTVSFGAPYEGVDGALDVSESDKVTRTMAIDKTRTIKFVMARAEGQEADSGQDLEAEEPTDDERADTETETDSTTTPSRTSGRSRIRSR